MSTFIDGNRTNRTGYGIAISSEHDELDIYIGNIFPGDRLPTNWTFLLIMQSIDQYPHLAVYVCTYHNSFGTAVNCSAVNNPDWNFSSTTFAQNHVLFEGIPQYSTWWYVYCIPLNFE